MTTQTASTPVNGDEVGTIINYEDWKQFVRVERPEAPKRMTVAKYSKLTEIEQEDYNYARGEHHRQICWVNTPASAKFAEKLDDRLYLNRGSTPKAQASMGIIVSGPSTAGKTSVITQRLRSYERSLRRREPETFDNLECERIPILYLQVPSPCTPKTITQSALAYLGLPTTGSTEIVTQRLAESARRLRVEIIVFDDIHFMDTSASGTAADNHAKNLISRIRAVPIFAGIGLGDHNFFNGDNTGQNANRHSKVHIEHIDLDESCTDGTSRYRVWDQIVKTFEGAMVLLRQKDTDLTNMADYLHNRTDGNLGSLAELLAIGAKRAISNGDERLSIELLDRIEIDGAAQERYNNNKKSDKGQKK